MDRLSNKLQVLFLVFSGLGCGRLGFEVIAVDDANSRDAAGALAVVGSLPVSAESQDAAAPLSGFVNLGAVVGPDTANRFSSGIDTGLIGDMSSVQLEVDQNPAKPLPIVPQDVAATGTVDAPIATPITAPITVSITGRIADQARDVNPIPMFLDAPRSDPIDERPADAFSIDAFSIGDVPPGSVDVAELADQGDTNAAEPLQDAAPDVAVPVDTLPDSAWFTTGSYLGTGLGQTIQGLPFAPAAVFVRRTDTALGTPAKWASMPAGMTKLVGENKNDVGNWISALTSDGFTVDASTDLIGKTYIYSAIREAPGRSHVGGYAGTAAIQSFTGFGFAPALVMVLSPGLMGSYTFQGMPLSLHVWGGRITNVAADGIVLDADGFTTGNNTNTNAKGASFYYLAIGQSAGFSVAKFVGDGAAGKTVSGLSFTPKSVWIQCVVGAGFEGVWRNAWPAATTDYANRFGTGTPIPGAIEALLPGGFRVGANKVANPAGSDCFYAAFD